MGQSQTLQTERVIELPAEREGESKIYRNFSAKDNLISIINPEVTTLHNALEYMAKEQPKNNFLGWRTEDTYSWISYEEVFTRAKLIGSGLVKLGLRPREDKVGITSINRIEWNLTEYACNANSLCLVPLYDTLGVEACIHILNECELSIIFCAADKVKMLLEFTSSTKFLKTIVQFEPVTDDQKEELKKNGIELFSLAEIENLGKENPDQIHPPDTEDLATICYTSGTTGLPKGVILTHNNIISAANGLTTGEVVITPEDIHISYLPSAHIFERTIATIVMLKGASMGYYSGDVRKLFEDINILKPTIFVTVPRLLGRLYDKVLEAVMIGGITQTVFEQAFSQKQKSGTVNHMVWDMVFSKVKNKLGGRVRFIITGSAPIAPNLVEFLRITFCCPVLEGYGQTETCCGGTRTLLWDNDTGHVGCPSPSIEIKLVDVPEMNYFSTDNPPRGEICMRGPTCTKGYYNNPEKTKELIDEHGWLHSGDVGCINPAGNLQIIDRVKNIFKLSQGEYVAPEKIEQIFTQSKWVAQTFIYGDSLKASIVGVIVPDSEVLLKWAVETNHTNKENLEALCQDEEINKMILDDINEIGKKQGLKGFELPRKIYLSHTLFSIENDLLTPTFKLKRAQAKTYFKTLLDALYEGLD